MGDITTGGISFFTGIVRGKTTRGKPMETRQLFYEAYPEMALEKMSQIVMEIKSRWVEIERVAIIQRTGELNPGEVSVLIACSGSHRDTGIFEAVRYGIDRLKEIVPVWKKEVTVDGEQWVEGTYIPKPGE
jgi:molybdopterin synthase catalytic subunit